jgi:hypothetical protein
MEGGCRDDTELDATLNLEGDQARPYRDAPRVVARAVDRVDQPTPAPGTRRARLLAEDRVTASLLVEDVAKLRFDGAIGLGHGRPIGLGLDDEITGTEPMEGDRVGRVREPQRELEVRAHRGPGH